LILIILPKGTAYAAPLHLNAFIIREILNSREK
jgi:hypothetical protein